MASWLQTYTPTRNLPRLWVERLWLVESKEPLAVVRTVDLHPGLNIVWAKEPESADASGIASAGHGVGKTSLCLLLRYCLGDDAPSITTLREKATAGFPKGGVAAKVHVDGTTWIVFRPYGAYSHSSAGLGDELESLLAGDLQGDFSAFTASLHDAFITKLPAASLPGSSQTLEWRHLLAWCIRDQKTRFDGFFHWRDGDGLGFRRSRQDPPLFVRAVLGVLDAKADRLIREVESAQSALTNLEQKLLELEREPVYGLAHVERQLRTQLKADEDIPIFETILGPSLQSLVADALALAEKAEEALDKETDAAEDALTPFLVRMDELRRNSAVRQKEREIAQSLLDASESEYNRLISELRELESMAGHCRHGDVDFSACEHIARRRSTPSLPWRISQRELEAAKPKLKADLVAAVQTEAAAKAAMERHEKVFRAKTAEVRRLQMRKGTSSTQRALLKSVWSDLQFRIAAREQGKDSPALERIRERRESLTQELNSAKVNLLKRSQERSERAEVLKALTHTLAERLLGEDGYGRFLPEHDERPFELLKGGEAYQVLAVLLGDIVCLIDSATSAVSHHPGFIVHDCPREADMSERLYREFLLMIADAESQLAGEQGAPFQYVVTTTSAPPKELRSPHFVVLELIPGAEEDLLFKRQLLPQLPW